MTPRIVPTLALAAALLVLAGCKQQATGQSAAPAEVLSGTISDAMVPYDRLTSQPPLDPRAVRTARPGTAPEVEASEEAPLPAPANSASAAVPTPVAPAE